MRKHLALNQVELAILLDTKQSYISHIERGEKGISNNLLKKIASAYPDINSFWLLTGQGEMISYNNKILDKSTNTVSEPVAEYQVKDIQMTVLLTRIQELEDFIRNKFPDFQAGNTTN